MSKTQVPAARNTLRILALLSTIDVPISASRIRNELDLPRSTTYHILNEMVDAGFVVHIPEHRTYGLGMAAYAMTAAYTKQQPLVRLATRHLNMLADMASGSAHLSRLAGDEIVYLQEVRGPRAVSLVTEVGVRLPSLKTASGRILLAHLPEVELKAIVATSAASAQYRELKDRLTLIRERGWDEEVEEVAKGQSSLAVALVDHLGRPAAAMAVTFSSAVEKPVKKLILDHLIQSAGDVSARMYGSRE